MTTTNSDFHHMDGHAVNEIRKVTIARGFTDNPAGSVLVTFSNTRVMCTASVERSVPWFKRDSGGGWLAAEYSTLPAFTHGRMPRESMRGRIKGRTYEISHLISRSLRVAIDLKELSENTINTDCGVLQADGGTRTVSVTGAYVAPTDALTYLHAMDAIPDTPLKAPVTAVSVDIISGRVCLDLPYREDSRAEVGLNMVITTKDKFVKIQGTGEEGTFDRDQLNNMLDSAEKGLRGLIALRQEALHTPYPGGLPWSSSSLLEIPKD